MVISSAGGVPPDRKNTNIMNLKYDKDGELVPEKTTGKTEDLRLKKMELYHVFLVHFNK